MYTILIVDDEKEMRKKYKDAFAKESFRIIEAADALGCAECLMRDCSAIDLIILDINIAEVDGKDIFDIIDQYDSTKQILISSVHPVQDQRLKIPRAIEYHNKADGEEALLMKVKNVLGITV